MTTNITIGAGIIIGLGIAVGTSQAGLELGAENELALGTEDESVLITE